MAAADSLITRDGPVAVPLDYPVPASSELTPVCVTASFDGSAAAVAFVPTLEVLTPAGGVLLRVPTQAQVAAGGSADVSWGPFLRGDSIQPNTGGRWLPYNAVFSAAGGGAAIGNGTIAAIYLQLGALVMVKIRMVFGSTSTFGAGLFQWTLPVTAVATPAIGGVSGDCVDSSAAADFVSFGFVTGTTVLNSFAHQLSGVGGNVQFMTATTPIVWAVSDICTVAAIYQAAI